MGDSYNITISYYYIFFIYIAQKKGFIIMNYGKKRYKTQEKNYSIQRVKKWEVNSVLPVLKSYLYWRDCCYCWGSCLALGACFRRLVPVRQISTQLTYHQMALPQKILDNQGSEIQALCNIWLLIVYRLILKISLLYFNMHLSLLKMNVSMSIMALI